MSEGIKNKTVKGVSWSFIDNIANQGISFIIGLVLARLLTPDEYGLIGIIMIFIALFNSIVDSGFSSALIRKHDIKDEDYNTVFITNLLISIFLFVTLYICAPLIAILFKQPQLTVLTRTMGIIVIINALAIIQRTRLVKSINFKTQAKISLIASIVSGIIGVSMAICELGVWSLVGQQISRQVINTVLLWIYNKWFPKFQFSKKAFKELFGFGWKLLVSGLIDTIWKDLYQIVIAGFYSPAILGFYSRAHQFGQLFSSNINNNVQRVSYPVLSSIQNDKQYLKEGYRKIIKTSMLVTFILMIGLAAIAKPMILVLIGEEWLQSVPMLQILCFSMMLYPLHSLNLNMLQVQGRSDLFLRLEIIKKIIAIGPLLLGIFIDIYLMLFGSLVTSWICLYINACYSGPFLKYSILEQFKDILPSLGIAITIAAIIFPISLLPISPFYQLSLQIIIGAIVAISLLEYTKLDAYKEIKKIVMPIIYKLRKK